MSSGDGPCWSLKLHSVFIETESGGVKPSIADAVWFGEDGVDVDEFDEFDYREVHPHTFWQSSRRVVVENGGTKVSRGAILSDLIDELVIIVC